MFENVIGNHKVISSLKHDIIEHSLPPSILLSGSSFVGKLTSALEIARCITCQKQGKWNCDCKSCFENINMILPDLLIIGSRDCILEIKAASQALLNNRKISSYYLFLRAVKKLTIRFDQKLYEPSDASFIKASSILPEVEENLNELKSISNIEDFDEKKLLSIVSSLEKKCEKLQYECMYDSIPISQVRAAVSWIHLKARDEKKILIIENADKMQEGARNAFLKILEEPPSYATFILTSQNKNAIMPTILSRTRVYDFAQRSAQEEKEVLNRVFNVENVLEDISGSALLPPFFYRYLPAKDEAIKAAAISFWNHIFSNVKSDFSNFTALNNVLSKHIKDEALLDDIPSIIASVNKFKPSIIYTLFLKNIIDVMHLASIDENISAMELKSYKDILIEIEKARIKIELYNMSIQSVLEELSERIGEIFR